MKEVSEGQGRTVLFVSHNMQSIRSITSRCLLLSNGRIILNNETNEVVNEYYRLNMDKDQDIVYTAKNPGTGEPYIEEVRVVTTYENNVHSVGDQLEITFKVVVPNPMREAAISFQIFNSNDIPVIHILNLNSENQFGNEPGVYYLKSTIPDLRLYPDNYYLKVHFADHFYKKKFETLEKICPFEVKHFGEVRDYYWYKGHAVYLEDNEWNIQYEKK